MTKTVKIQRKIGKHRRVDEDYYTMIISQVKCDGASVMKLWSQNYNVVKANFLVSNGNYINNDAVPTIPHTLLLMI